MEIVSIEKKTFEEMKERFGSFSQHVRELCARYRPPEKMNWMDDADMGDKILFPQESVGVVSRLFPEC